MPTKTTKRGSRNLATSTSLDLSGPLGQIANCLGFIVIHADELKDASEKDKVGCLFSLGFNRNQIATIIKKDPDTISVYLSQMGLTARSKKQSVETD